MTCSLVTASHVWIFISGTVIIKMSQWPLHACGLQYLRLVRGFKFYGYVVFKPCTTDYPHPDTKVTVATGNKELNFRIHHKVGICSETAALHSMFLQCFKLI